MALLTDSDTFVEYRYKITEFYIIFSKSQIELPVERIGSFKIENYYEDAYLPIFKFDVMLEASTYYKILKYKETVKFKVRIQRYYINNDNPNDKSMDTDVINDTFIIITDRDDSDFQEDLKKEAGTDKDENELMALTNHVELFLFKEEVAKLRGTYNGVVSGTLLSIVEGLLSQSGFKNNLISPFDNTSSQKDLLLPSMRLDLLIQMLNNNFGFHKTGTIIFFGLTRGYIMAYKKGCTCYAPKEWQDTVIYVLDKANTKGYMAGGYLKKGEKKYYFNVPTEAISNVSPSVVGNLMHGIDAVSISSSSNRKTLSSANAKTIGQSNTAVFTKESSNPYVASTYTAQTSASSTVLQVFVESCNLDAFTVNKNVSVVFENAKDNKKYKGKYHVITALHTFTLSGDSYKIGSILTIKKFD